MPPLFIYIFTSDFHSYLLSSQNIKLIVPGGQLICALLPPPPFLSIRSAGWAWSRWLCHWHMGCHSSSFSWQQLCQRDTALGGMEVCLMWSLVRVWLRMGLRMYRKRGFLFIYLCLCVFKSLFWLFLLKEYKGFWGGKNKATEGMECDSGWCKRWAGAFLGLGRSAPCLSFEWAVKSTEAFGSKCWMQTPAEPMDSSNSRGFNRIVLVTVQDRPVLEGTWKLMYFFQLFWLNTWKILFLLKNVAGPRSVLNQCTCNICKMKWRRSSCLPQPYPSSQRAVQYCALLLLWWWWKVIVLVKFCIHLYCLLLKPKRLRFARKLTMTYFERFWYVA